MEVVTATPNGGGVPPFHDHDVREWSRIDSITGALERARLETDHWSANTINSSHKYGKLSLNPLDLSSQKSKASVGRSASRRPPTRQRPREPPNEPTNPLRDPHLTAATNLHRVTRLCHQIHETAVRQAFGKRSSPRPAISDRENGDGSVEIYEIESASSSETKSLNGHSNLSRTKSTSSDDIHVVPEKDTATKSVEDLEDLEQLQNWRRTSKIRRSLQFPKQNKTSSSKPVDLPENSVSVRKIREDLEKGRRLNTALRNNSVDLEALDQILQSISSSSSIHSDKASDNTDDIEAEQASRKQKRNSFVTVESIKEVKGRLRRTSSPTSDIYRLNPKEVDPDDGIVTEEVATNPTEMPVIEKSPSQSRVRSYVYGMEALLNKKPGLGTGSLESRGKLVNNTTNIKNEDWYNRRKSYGFEQMHNQEESANTMSLKSKNLVESSTDSGICRSTEIVVVPTATKTNIYNEDTNHYSSDNSDAENRYKGYDSRNGNGAGAGQVKKMASSFNHDDKKSPYNKITNEELTNNSPNKFSHYKASDWSNNGQTELKSTTITIPIVKNNNVVDLFWNDQPEKEIKRHSIAVDESKYVMKNNENKFRRTSLALNDQYMKQEDDDSNGNRKQKKVEFCKTEVHFAAESGKVNIVATDEKPPPTQNFRRRRRITGFLNEDFNKNGLPVLHFGDSSYEKTMFGLPDDLPDTKTTTFTSVYENEQPRVPSAFGVVTVNTNNNANNDFMEEDKREQSENESIKGILKNKPIKPRPYHLGETVPFPETYSDEDPKNWGVKLKHVDVDETPIWKSTVTVHNYYDKQPSSDINDNDQEQPEFQKLLKNLRPTRKIDYASDNDKYSESFSSIRVVPAQIDNRSSWSMTDKTKSTEDNQNTENRGYSTRVNFGEGEATVVESDGLYDKERHPTWPRVENPTKDSKQILNKGLVVRIGREDSASNHTVCSKMTTTQDTNNTMTTTKITIDLSPSPPTKTDNCFTYAKYKRSQNHSFKSTSLILNTIKDKNQTKYFADKTGLDSSYKKDGGIPQQLEALKKLYEDVQSDSDADKEVQLLMSTIAERDLNSFEDDNSSVVSGSWSKMRAFKNISEHFSRTSTKEAVTKHDLKLNTKSEKDIKQRLTNETISSTSNVDACRNTSKYVISKENSSPVALNKVIPMTSRPDLKPAVTTKKLASPSLVGRSNHSYDYPEKLGTTQPIENTRQSPSKEFKSSFDKKLQTKHVNDSIVLRQPKKSEMTYFGINLSPKPVKKISQAVIRKESKLSDKPDLLQHYKKSPSPARNAAVNKNKPRLKSPESVKVNNEPIYENLKDTKGRYSREFDSSILDELTKAADQILQAVNGYTDEENHNRYSTDDEDSKKVRNEKLETISETKSWKQQQAQRTKSKPPNTRTKLKHTSSTSSVESLSRRKVTSSSVERKSTIPKTTLEHQRKKTEKGDSSTAKANTKARRLQRASSREALLQSHGSSSEDLTANVEVPVRKPRLIKKTKAMQLTVTNGLELKKPTSSSTIRKKEELPSKSEDRVLSSLPEIRHKTAVSTIRSTTDRSTRDRTRHRSEDLKKTPQKREGSRGINPSTREREKNKTTALHKETVTHRISTAYVPVCRNRSRQMHARHQDTDCP
ncbi:uncharacterized protein LOC108903338 isoform X3 [Anoplophora glabripennis]|uniref:uncharacterized protein LOC108903338 isoform X3 n=1 Tax=Anoplophora glabripennis TaxID=217634 RepID=UPI00087350FE|nr:uncharacterized protein LOC108903338 isoform X3 [Anoplophora glabripennis]